jgi:hypothetical protein
MLFFRLTWTLKRGIVLPSYDPGWGFSTFDMTDHGTLLR